MHGPYRARAHNIGECLTVVAETFEDNGALTWRARIVDSLTGELVVQRERSLPSAEAAYAEVARLLAWAKQPMPLQRREAGR